MALPDLTQSDISPSAGDIDAWRVGITRSLHSARRLCRRSTDMEAVGIIWTDGTVRELVNQARSMDRFSVGVRQFVEALAEVDPGEKTILSLFHSHPSGSVVASRHDRDSILYQWENGMPRPWTIIDPGSLSWSMWWVEGREVVGEEWREITHRIPKGM